MEETRSDAEYLQAREIIRIMMSEGVIPESVAGDNYLNAWNAAFAILDLLTTPKGK